MKLELRILNGLHRGASLPVEPGVELLLGSDTGCDVVLVDQGMAAFALRLGVEPDAWLAYPTDAEGQPTAGQPARLTFGMAFELSGIRICVCQAEQDWAFELAAAAPVIEAGPELQDDAPPGAADVPEPVALEPGLPAAEPAAAAADVPQAAPVAAARARAAPRRWDSFGRRVWLVLPITALLCMVTFRAASMGGRETAAAGLAALAAAPGQAASAPVLPLAPTPEELQRLFKARLQAAELLQVLELDLQADKWSLRGDLGPEEDARLERLVAAFFEQHRPKVHFEALIVPAEELLPFRIAQISAGRLAHVVTADGQRLFVGDTRGGYTLARVESARVVFTGKRRIEVAW